MFKRVAALVSFGLLLSATATAADPLECQDMGFTPCDLIYDSAVNNCGLLYQDDPAELAACTMLARAEYDSCKRGNAFCNG